MHFPTVILILLCSLFYILKLPVNGFDRIDFIKFTLECCIIYLFFAAIQFPLKEQTISRREFYYIVCAVIYMLVDICILHPIRFFEELYNQIIPQSYAEYNVTGSIFYSNAWEKDTKK